MKRWEENWMYYLQNLAWKGFNLKMCLLIAHLSVFAFPCLICPLLACFNQCNLTRDTTIYLFVRDSIVVRYYYCALNTQAFSTYLNHNLHCFFNSFEVKNVNIVAYFFHHLFKKFLEMYFVHGWLISCKHKLIRFIKFKINLIH